MSNLLTKNEYTDEIYLAAVNFVTPGLGRAHLPQLVEVMGSAKAIFEASFDELMAAQVLGAIPISNFIKNRQKDLPERIAKYTDEYQLKIVTYFSSDYPPLLKCIHDAPVVLYVKGTLPHDVYPVAVVGSRNASDYGIEAAQYFTKALVHTGIPIISGGALGIDSAAHEECIKCGGKTVAVIGSGFDQLYPYENIKNGLFERIAEHGAVVSEYGPGMAPLSANFPARNRIIVGLSGGVLVAQAAKRSGALITANIAADEGRDVFCVPCSIFERTGLGCHELIRNGAKLVDEPKDILEERNAYIEAQQFKTRQTTIFDYVNDDLEQDIQHVPISSKKIREKQISLQDKKAKTALGQQLLDCMKHGPKTLEQLTMATGVSFAQISVELLELQCDSLVAMDSAERYYRK